MVMMSSSMWPLLFKCEAFDFLKEIYKVHNVNVLSQDLCQQKNFKLTHNYKYGAETWTTSAQLGQEVICRRPKKNTI